MCFAFCTPDPARKTVESVCFCGATIHQIGHVTYLVKRVALRTREWSTYCIQQDHRQLHQQCIGP